jgi:serine/threonine protein kinase
MECVEGETLAKRLEKGPLPQEQLLKLGAQIADALDKAHRSGVVHRDLKPGNITLTLGGAKLLDFGLAKPFAPSASLATLTATRHQFGAPRSETCECQDPSRSGMPATVGVESSNAAVPRNSVGTLRDLRRDWRGRDG